MLTAKAMKSLTLVCCLLGFASYASAREVTMQNHPYFKPLVELALEKTVPSHGPYKSTIFSQHAEKERIRKFLERGRDIDVIWSTTNEEREERFLAVKFPLLKNLNEYRFLLIRKGEQERFDGIGSLEDLRKFTSGSGTHWQDTEIFHLNRLPTITSVNHEALFKMLDSKRFDYISRGAYEIWAEVENTEFGMFAVEKRIMLHYDAGYYFFVNKQDIELAERLEQGLKIAEADGSFDELFFSVPEYKKGWEAVHNHNRTLIELKVD